MNSYPASSDGQGETSASVMGNFSSQNYDKGSQRLSAVAESEEEGESDEGNHTELLLESMAREYAADKMTYSESPAEKDHEEKNDEISESEMERSPIAAGNMKKGAWDIIQTPIPPSPMFMQHVDKSYGEKFPPLSDYVVWPSLPHIVPLDEGSTEGGDNHSIYTVESPSGSPTHDNMAPEGRASRRQFLKMERVEEMATNRLKKRDAEGKKNVLLE